MLSQIVFRMEKIERSEKLKPVSNADNLIKNIINNLLFEIYILISLLHNQLKKILKSVIFP